MRNGTLEEMLLLQGRTQKEAGIPALQEIAQAGILAEVRDLIWHVERNHVDDA
ncbi:unnamed protein product, partial [marine sediment metagenome]